MKSPGSESKTILSLFFLLYTKCHLMHLDHYQFFYHCFISIMSYKFVCVLIFGRPMLSALFSAVLIAFNDNRNDAFYLQPYQNVYIKYFMLCVTSRFVLCYETHGTFDIEII